MRSEVSNAPRHDPGDVVYYRTPLKTLGMERVISTFANRLKVTRTRFGQPVGGVSFRGEELRLVAFAVDAAEKEVKRQVVIDGDFRLPSGARVVVGHNAGQLRIYVEPPNPNGYVRPTVIYGEELVAVRQALEDLGAL